MKKTVRVTDEDIKQGQAHDPHSCAIALCVKRLFPGYAVDVTDESIKVENGERLYALLPVEAMDFITAFDTADGIDMDKPDPITFEVEFEDVMKPPVLA